MHNEGQKPAVERVIISHIENRQAFKHLLENNQGQIILKFGAEWCYPCKQIEQLVHTYFTKAPPHIICGEIDVDQSFDLYAYLKTKKMISGIPSILLYCKGNTTFIPDDSISGTNEAEIVAFFNRCNIH
jgi:thioredoxin 1